MFNLTRPHSLLRLLGALALLVALIASTGGGCTVTWSGHDDDDDDCYRYDDDDDGWWDDDDDDCGGVIIVTAQDQDPAGFGLEDYVLEASEEAGTHPVRSLTGIEGLNLFRELGPGLHGEASFQFFTAAVLRENQDLLGLPVGAGHLRFFSVQPSAGGTVVTYVQESDAAAVEGFEAGAGVFFLFDSLGSLHEIHNLTVIPTGLADPAPHPEPAAAAPTR